MKEAEISIHDLKEGRRKKNEKLIHSMSEDTQWAEALMQACVDDADKGRMEAPRLMHEANLDEITVSPRFAVIQGDMFRHIILKMSLLPMYSGRHKSEWTN